MVFSRLKLIPIFLALPILATASSPAFPPAEVRIIPHGTVPNAGWARARLNDAGNLTSVKYTYPDTTKKVRLYLIDTAVKNPNGHFNANPNLTWVEGSPGDPATPSKLIRSVNDPSTSSAFEHGTKILSLIAGPQHGVALGTPIEVISYDIYPQGSAAGSTNTLLSSALIAAENDHLIRNDGVPAVICIAGGSSIPAASQSMRQQFQGLVYNGLTVVVSAGNSSANAADYIPAAYGTENGVICVAASNYSNATFWNSNTGSAVDLYAPGDNLSCLSDNGAVVAMNGTSPASAFVAATALATLSACPDLSPAEVEAELKKRARFLPDGRRLLQMPLLDSDGDGLADILETFFGTDPSGAQDCPTTPGLTCFEGVAKLHFSVNAGLFVPTTPYVLADGTTWTVEMSSDLKTWGPAEGTLTVGQMNNSRYPITYTCSDGHPNCYLRIRVVSGS